MTAFPQYVPPPPVEPLALDQPKQLGPLLESGWKVWRMRPSVFFLTAAWIVLPLELVLVGLLGGGFHDPNGAGDPVWTGVSSFVEFAIGSPLITAIHALAVLALARSEAVTTGSAFRMGLASLGRAVLTTIVYFFAIVLGTLLLILPGIFIAVAGLFAPQHAVLTGDGPIASLKASVRIVRTNGWWRTYGYVLVITLIGAAVAAAVVIPLAVVSLVAGEPSDFGLVAVPLTAVMNAAVASWTALATTLLYFSWRTRANDPYRAPGLPESSPAASPDWPGEAQQPTPGL